ncbi:sigma-54-dependent Fis family transcriptional regulator [Aquincola tertiaricarbonis]|uniref:Sigma-54-dependent Fis family transcriptional regulator n=1 Tax=Aquincola tertiaricarbonis TaxID=391953 RepID=A0ABY4SAR2_AQUTE|nr:sigma-54-dependent Fis family transcriptional regulator [Aquincola tertiaricarbonis]URI10447.1 sigma-54-dependent Fis family transcriptional regulator [Aquincola tertiaricarbonis]
MQPFQRAHIDTVVQLAALGADAPAARSHDEVIRQSWLRCVQQHALDPTRMQEAVVLTSARLREHQDQLEAFLHIARHGMESLYQQVAGMGYVVLLTDARGITVDFLGDLQPADQLRRAGLTLGADWSEPRAGTCGVGTCISTGQALTVHLDDHFDATHIPLTCTTAPVFDATGRLNAVLDISALSAPQPKASQHLALQLVKLFAHQIENADFLHRFRGEWILRLAPAPQFLDVNPDYLLAIDASGRVIGHNRRAQLLWETDPRHPLLGRPYEQVLDAPFGELGRFVQARPSDQRAVMGAGGRQLLFMTATPPPARPATPPVARDRRLPAPLAALSGGDAMLDRQIDRAARLVNSPMSLLVTGETGTGKEFFAKALHASSERRSRPFIAVNCAAIPETLIESELFGYLPGSFSGAGPRAKRGLIQEADGGTLFLDEIGDMPRPLQARLLRVLAEREVLPVGATRAVAVNIRVIAATHCDLEALVREGRFRDDLYYRLNGARFHLPPLRERSDIGWVIDTLLGTGPGGIAPEARALLMARPWPGNLRELRNVLEYARAVRGEGPVQCADLPEWLDSAPTPSTRTHTPTGPMAPAADPVPTPDAAMQAAASQLLLQLRAAHWNVSAVARSLGLSRMTLYRRMKRWGIVSPNQQDDAGLH